MKRRFAGGGKPAALYEKPRHKWNYRWKTKLFLFCMMLIPFLQGVGLDFFLKFETIRLMFTDQTGTQFGFYWIGRAFSDLARVDSGLTIAIINIFIVMIVMNFIVLPLQLVMSYFFWKKIPMTKFFRLFYYVPTMLSAVVTSLVFGMMFDNSFGPVTGVLRQMGFHLPLEGLLFNKGTALPLILVYTVWLNLGASTILVTAAMLRIPAEIPEAMRLDGASNFIEFIRIVVPMISPMISVIFVGNLAAGTGLYSEILLLTDPNQSSVFTASWLMTTGAMNRRYSEVAGLGFIFSMIMIPLILVFRKLFDVVLPDVSY